MLPFYDDMICFFSFLDKKQVVQHHFLFKCPFEWIFIQSLNQPTLTDIPPFEKMSNKKRKFIFEYMANNLSITVLSN